MSQVFISHASEDDVFVHALSQALRLLDMDIWIDSRELRGGDPLWPVIQQAIMDAAAYVVVVSPAALQSKWVGKELKFALKQQKKRGKEKFPVIPLSLNGTRLGVLESFFGEEPLYTPVSSAAGGVDAALHAILVALGKRLPTDPPEFPQPPTTPLEELVLELGDLKFQEEDGKRRACGRARLVYEPATPGQETVRSAQDWTFVAPLGPIEADELRWYLEKYAIWPSEIFRDRAAQVESQLVAWGQALHDAALPPTSTDNVLRAWEKIDDRAGRRFSVHIDTRPINGMAQADIALAREAATALLGLPWELLHDGSSFLFQGAQPTRVRRRLPNTKSRSVPVVAPPIRILLITARPEDDACGYIDHRISALPLVEAVEELGGLVQLHILSPATLPALRAELDRARQAGAPYHVVHFDGHGVYDRQVGLGGLCFERPEDEAKLERRGHSTIYTDELGPLLKGHRIPLVFLEACQSALAEAATDSVATALLQEGVASVVAMSHSVLVETARRFVAQFYRALAQGERVGSAMLAGQRHLKDDTLRGHIFGAGELRLEDWFVPVLFQEKDDPRLFKRLPIQQTKDDFLARREVLLGTLPPEPATCFVGRSRELLALERLLRHQRYAVIRGQGGEGKTALAAEFARWWVRSQQIERAVFVSVESHGTVMALLDALGRQLLPKYSAATHANQEHAILPIERALREQACLLVIDNMESVLLPPYLETPEALSAEAATELEAILNLCKRLNAIGETRLIFTSREALPAPFDAAQNRRELQQLAEEDAIQLVERALSQEGAGHAAHAEREAIAELVATVHGHARTLALLGPSLRSLGVAQTQANLTNLMAEMQRRFPGQREHSLFASVELSLQRLSPENCERVGVLGMFYGAVDLDMLRAMMEWEKAVIASLAEELVATGLATADPYDHLTLNPALCPYLRAQLADRQMAKLLPRWMEAMRSYVKFLDQQQHQNTQLAATLTGLELPNLFALLAQIQQEGDAEATIDLTTSLHSLLQGLGKPRLMERVAQVRDAAAARLDGLWNYARFQAQRTRVEQQLAAGLLREALAGAQDLLQRARQAGEQAYAGADYDLAVACFLLARVLRTAGGTEPSLQLLGEAQQRFETIERGEPGCSAAGMVSICFTERGNCLLDLGRLDEAASAYEEAIRRDEQREAERDVAVGKGQLGTVRLLQKRYPEALAAHAAARADFARLDDLGSIATSWHQTGRVLQATGQPQAAEDAYRRSLAIKVQLGDIAGQARTLGQLGNLYANVLERTEDAVAFFSQAANKHGKLKDAANEGRGRGNLATTLLKLQRHDEARQEIDRAIQCMIGLGHATEPWKYWSILANIETATHNPNAAAAAQQKATASYLAYRRDGGENHYSDGRLSLAISQALHANKPDEASTLLRQLAAEPKATPMLPFIQALQALLAGSRDPALADTPGLNYTEAAEILWLIETLPKPFESGCCVV